MNLILTIDIAHPPLPAAEAEAVLDEALRKIQLSSSLRILKIVHGFGSSGRGGSLKTMARNWAFVHRTRFKTLIPGEDLSPFNPVIQELSAECEVAISADLGASNDGVTILWVR